MSDTNIDPPVSFHILAEGNYAFKNSFGKFEMDGDTIRRKLDEFLRGVIEERFKEFQGADRIKSQLDRRIEIAMKTVTERLEKDLLDVARAHFTQRIRAAVDAIPLAVRIDTSGCREGE